MEQQNDMKNVWGRARKWLDKNRKQINAAIALDYELNKALYEAEQEALEQHDEQQLKKIKEIRAMRFF